MDGVGALVVLLVMFGMGFGKTIELWSHVPKRWSYCEQGRSCLVYVLGLSSPWTANHSVHVSTARSDIGTLQL